MYKICNFQRNLWSSIYKQCLRAKTSSTGIEDATAVEANLFDNSTHVNSPGKREFFKQRLVNPSSHNNNIKSQKKKIVNSTKEKLSLPKLIKDQELGLEFYRLSLHDPLIAQLMTKVRSGKRYDNDSTIVIEGTRLILEALTKNLHMQTIFFSQKEELQKISSTILSAQQQQQQLPTIYKVPHHDLKIWSTLTTPPGLLAIFKRPTNDSISSDKCLPITVICDNIREPNNLGSVIRTCAALPCKQLITTRGCCDPWEPKALRGGCGGHFHLKIFDGLTWDNLFELFKEKRNESSIFIAENNIEKLKTNQIEYLEYCKVLNSNENNIVIIGGESHGISDEAYRYVS